MSDPIRRLKLLPWGPLLQVAVLAVLALLAMELLLEVGVRFSNLVARAMGLLLSPPLGLLVIAAAAIGLGAIAVYLLERVRRDVAITTGVLWALVGCLMLVLLVRQVVPVFSLIGFGQMTLLGVVVGVFLQGRRYWRSYR